MEFLIDFKVDGEVRARQVTLVGPCPCTSSETSTAENHELQMLQLVGQTSGLDEV